MNLGIEFENFRGKRNNVINPKTPLLNKSGNCQWTEGVGRNRSDGDGVV